MKVLAAMSGGVDSAVAAARVAEAGHDVTGIHLALSRNPQSYRTGARGCCTIEDSNDARRAADVIGIPFYVWDLSERFHADVVEDFLDEYAAGRTPNPCLRCNEKIKFAAVLDRALALGFDAVATGHYAQLRTGRRRAGRDAPRGGHGQGPVLRARRAHPAPARPRAVPARRQRASPTYVARRSAAASPSPTSPTATTSASSATATPAAGWPTGWPTASSRTPGRSSTATAQVLGEHDGSYRFTVGQRKGLRIGRPAPDGQPRYVLDIEPVSGTVTVGPREALAVERPDRDPAAVVRHRARPARWSARCSCGPTATSTGRS